MPENAKIDLSGDGGAMKEIIKEGVSADGPQKGCKVVLHYTGRLTDGTVFDSSVDRGEPFEFDLGKGSVIKAFEIGVLSMKKLERCYLTCAPDYAYGAAGSPPSIPPNATLIFELELLDWKGEDVSPNKDGSIERFIVEASTKRRNPVVGGSVKAHITGSFEGREFENREVNFDFGDRYEADLIEGVELAIGKMAPGETSKFKIQSKYAFKTDTNKFDIPANSVVEYTIKLIDCEKGPEEWKMNEEERVEQSKIYKEKGTKYFKKNNYTLAIQLYESSINILEADNEVSQGLKAAAYNNIALCHQKNGDHFEGKSACTKVLELDPKNIKALYRRGQCNLAVNEYQAALDDLQKVVELEPSNKAAANQIQICRQKIRESNAKERKIYANMFSKFAAADNEPNTNKEEEVLACGEWTEEDAKHQAANSASFERDNNIVMI